MHAAAHAASRTIELAAETGACEFWLSSERSKAAIFDALILDVAVFDGRAHGQNVSGEHEMACVC